MPIQKRQDLLCRSYRPLQFSLIQCTVLAFPRTNVPISKCVFVVYQTASVHCGYSVVTVLGLLCVHTKNY